MQSNVFVGIKPGQISNYKDNHSIKEEHRGSFDYLLLPITNLRYKEIVRKEFDEFKNGKTDSLKISEPQLQDICISPFNSQDTTDSPMYIGLLSSWLELESQDIAKREVSYQVLLNECQFAQFVGIHKLILAPPRDLSNLQLYSQSILRLLAHESLSSAKLTISISLPLYEDTEPLATWELWNTVRKLCNYHESLTISLAVPRIKTPRHVINRWIAEPVSCLLISSSIFATNQYNYPVLHKFNQKLIAKFQEVNGNSLMNSNNLCVILHSMEKYSTQIKGGENSYIEYINYLLKKGDRQLSQNAFDSSLPQLMSPLKPHSDMLSNSIYSIFERDTMKYDLYEQAVYDALSDLSLMATKSNPLVILVAGAGRGPLVDRTFRSINKLNLLSRTKLIAVEKNPQAFLFLQKRNFEYWNNKVQLLNQDMTKLKNFNLEVDLCVSELLGSFGCNELSPECLYSIQQSFGKPSTIFIPSSYTSYVAPISSPLIHQKLKSLDHDKKPTGDKTQDLFESIWVSHKIPYNILSSKINEIWSFHHPLPEGKLTSFKFSRNVTTGFKIKHKGEIHGLIGFFKATLYKDLSFSNLPNDTNAYSWSPIIFPLNQPLSVTDDTEVNALLSRVNSGKKIWYEWSLESFIYVVMPRHSLSKMDFIDDTKGSNILTSSNDNNNNNNNNNINNSSNNNYDDHNYNKPASHELDSGIDENGFLPNFENGWQSVNDIHGLHNSVVESPMFNLGSPNQLDEDINQEEQVDDDIPEIHIKVETGISKLHNINGQSFSIPL
ncbi:hypothetical protein KAFR_0K01370 [Kazachstania africana CBS 2517]|uniref:Protein arginine N-methyltransferase n=1 Tax=Kazachstania africana (strain ATCC 22294 / BCRC 22015 / CBS 2517 / CECT 1963 / NBRC 1671 / NRRL Y-8276) TaxID=1071382 RepID=H2B1J1_KAZAF|nr:hypothetical protein KAFR_0K01370 [Kazachstania africana CBS 2517]CCF60491.1 hypothetical protein KAFR_0K01370 [Kazachstania africana CBS 2517]